MSTGDRQLEPSKTLPLLGPRHNGLTVCRLGCSQPGSRPSRSAGFGLAHQIWADITFLTPCSLDGDVHERKTHLIFNVRSDPWMHRDLGSFLFVFPTTERYRVIGNPGDDQGVAHRGLRSWHVDRALVLVLSARSSTRSY